MQQELKIKFELEALTEQHEGREIIEYILIDRLKC